MVPQDDCIWHPRAFRVRNRAARTPAKRNATPTPMMGKTSTIFGKMSSMRVLLPTMLKRMSCPKTQTPPMMLCTSRSSSRSETMAKVVLVTMTKSSDWNHDPGAKPMGTSSRLGCPAPKLYATRATVSIMRNDSTGVPVKTGCPLRLSCNLREISQPLATPRAVPTAKVARMRRVFARTSTLKSTEYWWAGSASPQRKPKDMSANEPSSGAQVNTNLGNGCSLELGLQVSDALWQCLCGCAAVHRKWFPNSFIFGITSPGPRGETMVPSTKASFGVKPSVATPYAPTAKTSRVQGSEAITKM
mmetsp:Transcript_2521/g.7081  ORF Transcript_2521/g.7081 Transcript_2521/m.7081 type:complete len:302 (+) Transcript_2521:721-1626(+)